MDDHTLIRLEKIHFRYAGRDPVFTGLDLVIRDGDRLGVVGANGSGKTTTIRMSLGIIRPEKSSTYRYPQTPYIENQSSLTIIST